MTKQLTIRGVSDEVASRLEALSREKGTSVNATVLEILSTAVGYQERRKRLARYATWTEEDRVELDQAIAAQRPVNLADWS